MPLTPSVAVKVAVADRPSAAITRFDIAPFVTVASSSEKVVASIASEKVKVTWAVVPASSSGVVAIATVTSGLAVSIVTEAVFEARLSLPVTSVNLSAATETEPVPLTPSVAVKVAVADRPSAAIESRARRRRRGVVEREGGGVDRLREGEGHLGGGARIVERGLAIATVTSG